MDGLEVKFINKEFQALFPVLLPEKLRVSLVKFPSYGQ